MDLNFNTENKNILTYYIFPKGFNVPDELLQRLGKLQLSNGLTIGSFRSDIRRTKIAFLSRDDFQDVYEALKFFTEKGNNECFRFQISKMSEQIQYAEYYATDSGFYDWHYDLASTYSRRKISVIVQLSDPSEYEGGELQIRCEDMKPVTISKEKGSIILFPSYLLHRVTPVTKGVRKSLVVWIDGPPFS